MNFGRSFLHALRGTSYLTVAIASTVFFNEASAQVAYNVMADVPYAAEGNPAQTMDLYLPNTQGSRPIVYLMHGGCFTGGDKAETADTAQMLASNGFIVANINYTLANAANPATLYPKSWTDIMKAVRYMRVNAASYGMDLSKQASWGESAGGTLAGLLSTKPVFTPSWTQDTYSAPMNASVVAHARWDFTHRDPALPAGVLDCAERWMGVSRTANPTKFSNSNPLNYIGRYTPHIMLQCNYDDTTVLPEPHCEAARSRMRSFKRPHHSITGAGGHFIAGPVQKEAMYGLMARFGLAPVATEAPAPVPTTAPSSGG